MHIFPFPKNFMKILIMKYFQKLKESLSSRESKCWRFYKWLGVIVKYYFKEHLAVRKLDVSNSDVASDVYLPACTMKDLRKACVFLSPYLLSCNFALNSWMFLS